LSPGVIFIAYYLKNNASKDISQLKFCLIMHICCVMWCCHNFKPHKRYFVFVSFRRNFLYN